MAFNDKVIVTIAPTSNFHGKEANPALPYSPEEVAEAVYECWNEGASLVHIHGRDKNGLPTNSVSFFQEADRRIREKKCDIIIEHSMAPANPALLGQEVADIDGGLETSTTTPPPEMVSLEMAPSCTVMKDKIQMYPWNRLWALKVAKGLLEKGIKPELEIYNNSDVDNARYLIDHGALNKPYYLSFCLDMHQIGNCAMRYSPKHIMHLVDILPEDSLFSVLSIGSTEIQAATMSLLLGGNVRVGFEDNIYISKGKLAKNNAELVSNIVKVARTLGREIATPDGARQMLGLPNLKK